MGKGLDHRPAIWVREPARARRHWPASSCPTGSCSQKHDAARAVRHVVVVRTCSGRGTRGQFGGRRRVDDDVVSVLDPERAAGNGSNDHGKVDSRHQLGSPHRLMPAANGSGRGQRNKCDRPSAWLLRPERHQRIGQRNQCQQRQQPYQGQRDLPGQYCREASSRAGRQPILRGETARSSHTSTWWDLHRSWQAPTRTRCGWWPDDR